MKASSRVHEEMPQLVSSFSARAAIMLEKTRESLVSAACSSKVKLPVRAQVSQIRVAYG
jgi:hypothetical protein